MGELKKLHAKLINKEISAEELTQRYLGGISTENQSLNGYISVNDENALFAARQVDRTIASNADIDVLSGIPMALKDNISTKGEVTSCCSKILESYRPIYDASSWKKIKSKQGVLLGKTNMDEFAMGCSTEASAFGVTRNPHNKAYVAGGSSGGAAAAVSAGLAVYSLGSDTGGSVRQPAAFCGCVGFKPTYGAISRFGLISYASSLDTVGVLAQSTEDAALVFDRISGFDPLDSTSCKSFKPCCEKSLNDDIKGTRIGILEELISQATPQVKSEILNAVATLESMGARTELFSMPELNTALAAYYIIACAEASSNLGRYDSVRYASRVQSYDSIHQMICKTRAQLFGDEVKKRILLGTFVLSEGYYHKYYAKAQKLRISLCECFEKAFEKYDILLAPTSPTTAFKIGEATADRITAFNSDLCTAPVSLVGLPAISLPCGKDAEGLPIGLQLIGKKLEDARVLNFAHKYEQARGAFEAPNMGVRL